MLEFYAHNGICLCPMGGTLPQGASAAAEPFAPLVFLVARDPRTSRGFFAIEDIAELLESEGPALLLPLETPGAGPLAAFVREHGAAVLNTAFSRCFEVYSAYRARQGRPLRLTLVGLGDVGGAVLTGLKLLGRNIDRVAIYDPNAAQRARYEMELGQVLPVEDGYPMPEIVTAGEGGPSARELFDCDALLFTASRGVPGLDAGVLDVRMAQYEANRQMLASYAKMAREAGFTGLFAQISDPVDHLARGVFLDSNAGEGGCDWGGLLPEQVRGFGLGVMRARAMYYAKKEGLNPLPVRAYGPHGAGLVIANDGGAGYDDALSKTLTRQAAEANLAVRALGFKPYIAPGLSSACVSVLRALGGAWHDGAVPIGGAYFGCTARFGKNGPLLRREPLAQALFARIGAAHAALCEFDGKRGG